MELNINRDIIKWNKLWAKDNQYTSICCLHAQKKLIGIESMLRVNVQLLHTLPWWWCSPLFVCSSVKKIWVIFRIIVAAGVICRGSVLNVSSSVPGKLVSLRAHLGSEAHRLEILESHAGGGTQQQATEKIYFAKQIQSLGGKNSICLGAGLCSLDFVW